MSLSLKSIILFNVVFLPRCHADDLNPFLMNFNYSYIIALRNIVDKSIVCSGVLLRLNTVLMNAQCICYSDSQSTSVKRMRNHTAHEIIAGRDLDIQKRGILHWYIHDKAKFEINSGLWKNDLAAIILTSPFVLNGHIGLIPQSGSDLKKKLSIVQKVELCKVIAWHSKSSEESNENMELIGLEIRKLEMRQCRRLLCREFLYCNNRASYVTKEKKFCYTSDLNERSIFCQTSALLFCQDAFFGFSSKYCKCERIGAPLLFTLIVNADSSVQTLTVDSQHSLLACLLIIWNL